MDWGAERLRHPHPRPLSPKARQMEAVSGPRPSMAPRCSFSQYEGRCDGWGGRKFFYLLTDTCALSKYSNLRAPANPLINDSLILASQKSMVTMN